MELNWDYSAPGPKTESPSEADARDEAAIAELELGLQEAVDTDRGGAFTDEDEFVRQWMAERLSSGL